MAEEKISKNNKQLITIIERSAILILIIILAIIMRWSSDRIKERRKAYLKLGTREQRVSERPISTEIPAGGAEEVRGAGEVRGAREVEDSAEFYFDQGLRFARTGRFDEAIAAMEKAIEINPLHYRAMSNLGLVYKNIFLTNRNPEFLDKAIEIYKRAIDINPNFSDVYNNLGDAYFNQEKYAEAEKEFKKAIGLDPLNINAYNNLGVALIMQDKKEEALRYWRRSLEITPSQPRVREYIQRNEG